MYFDYQKILTKANYLTIWKLFRIFLKIIFTKNMQTMSAICLNGSKLRHKGHPHQSSKQPYSVRMGYQRPLGHNLACVNEQL